ncbi:MAG: ATP-dependent RNA helicase RhlE [Glaciecola sp.]|jgi:ATP-dependent RNA helicase RhlE
MSSFRELNLSRQLLNAIEDLGFKTPTPIQEKAFPVLMSGRDVVGIAQTGTGKTLGYMLPLLQTLKFSKQITPRIIIVVPTRELVVQIVDNIKEYSKYNSFRVVGVYGGTNINAQARDVAQGCDIIVATPGRLYDLAMDRAFKFSAVTKLVIDEVDVMLDLGFRPQLKNIFDLLPGRRQNIMFSATMTDEVSVLIDEFFIDPVRVAIAASGTRLESIDQTCYPVRNFYSKINLLTHVLRDKEEFHKVLVFVSSKKNADILFEKLIERFVMDAGIIHSNKSQNYRLDIIKRFDTGSTRVLIATDVIARGIDLDKLSHVINFDTPSFPENYMHRIGRAGRAGESGKSMLFFTEAEEERKDAIEELMDYKIPQVSIPEEVKEDTQLLPEERDKPRTKKNRNTNTKISEGGAFHEKSEKNSKNNEGGSYRRKLAAKYKKAYTKGDKIANRKKK